VPANKNPSYASIAAMKAFENVDGNDWTTVINSELTMINANTTLQTAGLPSDWCSTSGTPVAGNSSLQFGYDAIRVPFRMALGYAWYGFPVAKSIDNRIVAWTQGSPISGTPGNVKDGYSLTGTATGSSNVATFVGALGSAGMVDSTTYQSWVDKSYQRLKSGATSTGYYHASLKVLYELLMSGNFNDLWDSTSLAGTGIAPHPALDVQIRQSGRSLLVEAVSTDGLHADLLDLSGRTLRSASTEGSSLSLDTRGLAQGVYALRVKGSTGMLSRTLALTGN
jgi:hypothetical protein